MALGMLSLTHIMPVLVLNACMDANISGHSRQVKKSRRLSRTKKMKSTRFVGSLGTSIRALNIISFLKL